MDSSLTFYLVLGALLVGFIVLGMLKGMIKMLLFCLLYTSDAAGRSTLCRTRRAPTH